MQYVPKIDKDSAVKRLKQKENFFQRKKNICQSELIYVPYYLFSVNIHMENNKTVDFYVCVDTIIGECAYLKERKEIKSTASALSAQSSIDAEMADERVRKFITNEILLKKKKLMNHKRMDISLETVFEYPYWIGYFRRDDGIDFSAIDGVTGQKQGPKMKTMFIKYLLQ